MIQIYNNYFAGEPTVLKICGTGAPEPSAPRHHQEHPHGWQREYIAQIKQISPERITLPNCIIYI